MRVDDPMLSIVATRRSAFNRSGAIVPRARQAPLNSSISDRSASNSCVTLMVSVLSIPVTMPDYTGLSTGNITGLHLIRDTCQAFYLLIRLRKGVEMGVIGY